MVALKTLTAYLDETLEKDAFDDVSLNGLQVEGKAKVKKLVVGVTATLELIEKAVKEKACAILVHHGLLLKVRPEYVTGVFKKKLELLIKNNISLLAYHLPLDAHQEFGNNWPAALDLGWQNLEPFCLYKGKAIGVKGEIKPCSPSTLTKALKKYYQIEPRVALGGKKQIQTLALVSGGAHRELSQAIKESVDAYITGTADEPQWAMAHEENIHFFALGHHHSERIGPRKLGQHLAQKYGLDVLEILEANPF